MSHIDFHSGNSKNYYDGFKNILFGTREEHIKAMQKVLTKTLELARRTPSMQEFDFDSITTLDDLKKSGLYMDPDVFLPRENSPEIWQRMLGDVNIRYTASTSGSTGMPKFMSFTDVSLEHATNGMAAFFEEPIKTLYEQGIEQPVILALTGTEQFVTYKCIPQLFKNLGVDVVHIPLANVLIDEEAATGLVKIINKMDIHGISSLPTMMKPLTGTLMQIPNGKLAVERLTEHCSFAGFGGSEIYPILENYLRDVFGTIVNMLASTEYLVALGSDGGPGCQIMHTNPEYCIAGLIPLDETEKENPKMIYLHEADVGMRGELVLTLPAGIPWINARTSDYVEVVEGHGKYTTPAVEYWAKGGKILDIGGARIYPQEFEKGFAALEDRVSDWLLQAVKGEETKQVFDTIHVHYEGSAKPKEVFDSLVKHSSEFGDLVTDYPMFQVRVTKVEPHVLEEQRVARMQMLRGAPGPMKHNIVKGLVYANIPCSDEAYVAGLKS
ncbi:MAG: hypothetical protein ACTSUF_12880 [Candidatus Heimdallarchaeaceae archaeon]